MDAVNSKKIMRLLLTIVIILLCVRVTDTFMYEPQESEDIKNNIPLKEKVNPEPISPQKEKIKEESRQRDEESIMR